MTLAKAAELIDGARQRASLRGDPDAARRLGLLARAAEGEAEYDRLVEKVGLPVVRHRDDAPPGSTLGWWLVHDPHVRAVRQARGLRVDYANEFDWLRWKSA